MGRVNVLRSRRMMVDVIYQGLSLAKATTAREEGEGAFVELEMPMPVGTVLTIATPDGERSARVERVHEGVGPGVVLRFGDSKSLGDPGSARTAANVPPPSAQAEPNAPMAEMKSAPVAAPPPAVEAIPSAAVVATAPASNSAPLTITMEAPPEDNDDPPPSESNDPKKRRERRGKNRKTVIGH